jgi:hypothetical protein
MDSEENYKKSQDNINDIDINTDREANYPDEIKEKIVDLKKCLDKLDKEYDTIRDRISDLATQLDESKLCDTDEISIRINEILKDEIKKGQITKRWIKKCLPPKYKRKYTKKKREVSSLSTKKKYSPLLVSGKSGKSFAITQEENISTETDEKKDPFYYQNDRKEPTDFEFSNEDLMGKNQVLKDTLDKTTVFQAANNLIKEIQEKFKEIINALNKCNKSVFIRFNAKGIIESIESDTNRSNS